MMVGTKKQSRWKFGFFPVWQEGREGRWLKSMSANGWHLKKVRLFFYQFEKGEPRDYEYVLDFVNETGADMQEYRGLIEDTGWQYIDKMSGWQYFRIDANKAKNAAIYTDTESLKDKYRRILTMLGVSGLPLMLFVVTGSLDRPYITDTFLVYVIGALMAFWFYAVIRMSVLILRK
jgi:hypothetical protein